MKSPPAQDTKEADRRRRPCASTLSCTGFLGGIAAKIVALVEGEVCKGGEAAAFLRENPQLLRYPLFACSAHRCNTDGVTDLASLPAHDASLRSFDHSRITGGGRNN